MTSPLVGLKDLYFATLTSDDASGVVYAAPVKLANAVSAKITVNNNSATLFADDGPVAISNQISDISVSLDVDALDNANVLTLLGLSKDANGVLKYDSNAVAPYVAVGFRSKKANGKYKYIWLLKGTFSVPAENFQTQQDKVQFQTKQVDATFITRIHDQAYKFEVDEDDTGIGASVISSWFTSVYQPA